MEPEETVGIIELGDIEIKCLIFKIKKDKEVEILSSAITSSQGISNDVIENLSKASNVIRKCISNAEKEAKVSLKKINVVFEQPDFLSTKLSKHKKINGTKIHKEDIDFLLKEAKKQITFNDENQSIIHIFNYNYIVDEKTFVDEPIGFYADNLTHQMTFITTLKNNLKNINQAFIDCDIEVDRFISKTFASGVKLFAEEELSSGSILIDLGFNKISLGLFKNLALVHSITFPFGVNHIAKDLSKVCSLKLNESQKIINNIDFSFTSFQNIFDENGYLKNNYFIDSNFRKISKKLILDVIKARASEFIDKIKKQLAGVDLSKNFTSSVLLIGEGSNFLNIEKYFLNSLGINLRRSYNEINNRDDFEKKFSSSLGALKIINYGWETEAIPEKRERNIEKVSFFAKIFSTYK
jgi:cell division protein FtsA